MALIRIMKLKLFFAALGSVVFLMAVLSGHAAATSNNQNKQDYYLDKIIIERSESFLGPTVRKFRGFPHLDKAYRLMDENRYSESRIEFQKFFEIDPYDIKARLAYVIMLHGIKDYRGVIRQTSLVLKQIGNSVPFLQYRALAHDAIGNKASALRDSNLIIANGDVLEEDKFFALEMSLLILLEQKAYRQSLDLLEQYPDKNKDYSYFMHYATAQEGLGDYYSARKMLDKAILHSKTKNEVIEGYLALGNINEKNKKPLLAVNAYQYTLAMDRGNLQGLRSLSNIYYNLGHLDKAIDMMTVLLKQRYDDDDQEFLANLYFEDEDYVSAAESYKTLLLKTNQDVDLYRIYMLIGNAYSNAKQHAKAVEAFQHAAKIKRTREVLYSLANLLEDKGDIDHAIKIYQDLLNEEKETETFIKLSNLFIRAGDTNSALQTLELALKSDASEAQKKTLYRSQGDLFYRGKKFFLAKVAFQKAVRIDPSDSELLNTLATISLETDQLKEALNYLKESLAIKESVSALFMLAEVEERLGNWENSAKIYRHLIQINGLSSKHKSNALISLGLISLNQRQEQLALGYLKEAASVDEQNWTINRILGNTYASLDWWNDAFEQYWLALSKHENLENLLNFAQANGKLNKINNAFNYFQQAMERADKVGVHSLDKKGVLDRFGFFLVDQKEYDQAADNWRQSLRIKEDPVIRMRLITLLGPESADGQSIKQLESIDKKELSAEQNAERYDFIARYYAAKNQNLNAINAQKRALDIIKTAQRHYTLGNYFQSNKQNKKAFEQFKNAVDLGPENKMFVTALAYAYLIDDQLDHGIQILENVAEEYPEDLMILKDLAYLNKRNSDNKASEYWFKQAIDVKIAQLGSDHKDIDNNDELVGLKKEVRELTDNLNITAYANYRQNNNTANFTGAPGSFGGVIPSQGGVELDFRPPIFGLRDNRTLTFFSRVLWSMEPDSFKIDSETFQSTLGVRYKPFKTQNFNLNIEKLFKIGDSSQDNWLIRGMYGWTSGFDINYGKQYWNYTTLFSDLGYFLQSPTILSFYGEARQGISYKLWDNIVLTPHAVMDGRVQTEDESNVSYLEVGGGLSLKYFFNQTRYSVPKSYIELLLHYKDGLVNIDSGFNATAISRY